MDTTTPTPSAIRRGAIAVIGAAVATMLAATAFSAAATPSGDTGHGGGSARSSMLFR